MPLMTLLLWRATALPTMSKLKKDGVVCKYEDEDDVEINLWPRCCTCIPSDQARLDIKK